MERTDLRDDLEVDEVCARCATPLVVSASVVRRDGGVYCCGSCARADGPQPAAAGEACAHCGAPITDRASAVSAEGRVYCCPNCAAAPPEVEPPVV